jgi:hypothetical protein
MANPKSGIPYTAFSAISVGGGRVRPDWNAGGSSALSTQLSSVYSAGSPLMHMSTKTFTVQAQSVTPQSILTTFSYPGLVIGDNVLLNQFSTWSGPVDAVGYCAADNVLTVVLSCASTLAQSIVATQIRATRLSFASGF